MKLVTQRGREIIYLEDDELPRRGDRNAQYDATPRRFFIKEICFDDIDGISKLKDSGFKFLDRCLYAVINVCKEKE